MTERANSRSWPAASIARVNGAGIRQARRAVLQVTLIALAYFVIAKLGLYLAVVHPSASPVWPATGIAIAAVLLWGYRIAPAVFVAAFFVNQLTAGSIFTSLSIAAGNTLEAVVASYLVQRWGGGQRVFDTAVGIGKFSIIAVVSTALSASIGPLSLTLGGYLETNTISQVALTWWLGDLAGAVVVTPVVLLWCRNPTWRLSWENPNHIAFSYLGAIAVGLIAFSPLIPQVPIRDLLGFLAILPLLWAGLRLDPRHTANIALILSAFALWGTFRNGGPFATANLNDSFLLLIMFIISTAVPSLALSADLSERRNADEQQQQRALETEVLWQASLQVASGGTFEELLQGCLERICRLTSWPAGHVYLPDDLHNPVMLVPSSVWHFSDGALTSLAREVEEITLHRGEGLPGRIWESGESLWVPDISESQNLPRKTLLLNHGLHAAFGFPIYSEGRLQAVLEFFSDAAQPPDEHLLRVVQSIGQQLGRVLERQRANEQQQLLLKELSHRVGNTLAVTRSMFRRSVQHATDMRELETAFCARLMNLSAVYRHLSDQQWQLANVGDLVRAALQPYCAPDYADCHLEGSEIWVSASMALSLMMILHELAANAAKHGAFARKRGTLGVRWQKVGPAQEDALHLKWQEFGGSCNVKSERSGYGFTLIDATTKSLGAKVERHFLGEGILVELTIPLR